LFNALLVVGLLLSACAQQQTPAVSEKVLARVGTTAITEADFEEALQRLGGAAAQTLEEWRQQFQVLVDKHLLLAEARRRNLQTDVSVLRAVAAWERDKMIDELLRREMGEELTWDEAELETFFIETGAGREIRLQRFDIAEQKKALSILGELRSGASFAAVAQASGTRPQGTDWLNLLVVGPRYAPLFLLEEEAVELVQAEGRYLLVQVVAQRQVSLSERRELVAAALGRRKEQKANIAYLARLAERYEVQLDTAALAKAMSGAQGQRLLKSSLGEWTSAEYAEALTRLEKPGAPPASSAAELGFRVTRAYIADRLLGEEAQRQGWREELAGDREKLLLQKMLELLWEREVYAQVRIDENDLRAFYEQNKGRYTALANNEQALQAQVARDLRDAKAAPVFDRYIENLRQQSAAQVLIEEENFRAFVARKRQDAAPVDM
jgi:hypothetical protein